MRTIDDTLGKHLFQSTLSMRRATHSRGGWGKRWQFQSTLSMRRATDIVLETLPHVQLFQSTLSMRRATVQLDIFVRFLRRKPAA